LKNKQRKFTPKHFVNTTELVSSFMNLPNDRAEKKMKHPLAMVDLVEKVWEDWGIGEDETTESLISGNWQKIVGRDMASKCAPTNLSRDGKSMQIRAASSTVKQELTFRKTEILKKLQTIKGCKSIEQIRIF
jgi:hypothetical protein